MCDDWDSPDENAPVCLPPPPITNWRTDPRPAPSYSDSDWGVDLSQSQTFSNQRGRSRGRGFRGRDNLGRDVRFGRGRGGWDSYDAPRNHPETIIIKVPTAKLGKIIGRGGAKISELQAESGAKINIIRENCDEYTPVHLVGNDGSTQKAKDLIERLLEDRPRRDFRMVNETKPPPELDYTDGYVGELNEHPEMPSGFDWQKLSEESVSRGVINLSFVLIIFVL